MFLRKTGLAIALTLLFLPAWTPSALADLKYTKRGNWYEGVRSGEVGAVDIALLSATVDFGEAAQEMPDRLKLKFYLDQPSKVFVIVRELVNRYYYWLDNVRPERPWRAGFDNNFEWPTGEVLRKLDHIRMDELGILVRLEDDKPRADETVAPAIFFYSRPPRTIQGYRFIFKTRADAELTCSLYKEPSENLVYTRPCPEAHGGRPFTVLWTSSTEGRGWHRLLLKGYFRATKKPIIQRVRFYHQPEVGQ